METENLSKNKMTSMNISLPEGLRSFVEAQVAMGYGTVSEYIRELVRKDRERKSQARLEELLLEGLESGKGETVTPQLFQELKNELASRGGKGTPK
jgi:antitoxin ParD1/3/4